MNTLSWMIYAADVVSRLGAGLAIFGTLALGCALIFMLFMAMNAADGVATPGSWKGGFKVVIPAIFAMFLACFLPSSSTIYMIAASETGEQIIRTPEAREMLEAVKMRIMEELKVDGK